VNFRYLYCITLFVCISQLGYSQRLPWRNVINRQQTQSIPAIEINPGRITYGEVKLSDMVKSIEYIPLETTDESLVGRIGSFDISDNYIVVSCFQAQQVFLFLRGGRFISRIGRQGQGAGEYSWAGTVLIDEERDRVLVDDIHRGIWIYNLRGEFVGNISRNGARGALQRFHNDHFFIYNFVNSPFAYEIRDIDLQLITEGIQNDFYRVPITSLTMIGRSTYYLFNDKIHVRNFALNDTLFSIENNFSFTPRFVVNAGRLTPTINLLTDTDPNRTRSRALEYAGLRQFYETANKLLISYNFQNKLHFAYFDKNAGRLFHSRSESGIPNDFDGGVDFWPQRQDNLIWYAFYDAYYLIENSNGIRPISGSAVVQSFNRLIEKLDPDDNPVLKIVRIRE
jgi:hypothetical protein